MKRSQLIAILVGLALVLAVPLAESVFYTVSERELAVLLQFGQPVASRTQPGALFQVADGSRGHAPAQDPPGLARHQPR